MKKQLLAALISLVSLNAHAYMNLLTTGDMIAPQQFGATGYLESVFDEYEGINVNARGTYGISDELSADLEIGAGEFNVMLGAFAKWVPIPDVDNQPAIGVRAGLTFVDADNTNETSVSATPFVSKAFQTDQGRFNPYGGIMLATNSNDNDTFFASRLILGSEWKSPLEEWQNVRFLAEFGFELSKSFSSLTVGASYNF